MKKEGESARLGEMAFFCVIAFVSSVLLRKVAAPLFVLAMACFVASLVDSPARKLSKRIGRSRGFWAVLLAVSLFLGLGILLGWLGSQIKAECQRLHLWLSEHREELSLWAEHVRSQIGKSLSELPFCASVGTEKLLFLWEKAAHSLGERLLSLVARTVGGVPRFFLLAVISVIATLYLCADYERLKKGAFRMIPPSFCDQTRSWGDRVLRMLGIYVRACFFLAGLAFLEVSAALWILRIPCPLLIALGIALVDLLPVLGAGTVLIPWGLFSLAIGNGRIGWGLLALYAILVITRQLAEPKLIGERIGLSPFVSLMSVLFGLWTFGLAGAMLGPLLALVLKEWFERAT